MSYTIVIDEEECKRMIENRFNATLRHCRIGKVRMKTGIPWADKGILKPPPFTGWPYDAWKFPTSQYMDKCGCKVGSACGNVACPHRLIATC